MSNKIKCPKKACGETHVICESFTSFHCNCGNRIKVKDNLVVDDDEKTKPASSLDVQVGGGHYKDLAIQPIEFTHKNNLNFCQGNIVKYVTRYKDKNGKQDLEKAKHYIDLLIELEYGE